MWGKSPGVVKKSHNKIKKTCLSKHCLLSRYDPQQEEKQSFKKNIESLVGDLPILKKSYLPIKFILAPYTTNGIFETPIYIKIHF